MINTADLVLASASPRRRELLSYFGLPFQSVATDAEEQEHAPEDIVALLPTASLPLRIHDHPTLRAWRKAHAVYEQMVAGVIIAADTIVVLDEDVLNKPEDAAHARMMLRRLSGREHIVYTGLAVLDGRPGHTDTLLLDLVLEGKIDPSIVISHRYGLDEAADSYRMLNDKADSCTKIVLSARELARSRELPPDARTVPDFASSLVA